MPSNLLLLLAGPTTFLSAIFPVSEDLICPASLWGSNSHSQEELLVLRLRYSPA
jgi:hypothetical protein